MHGCNSGSALLVNAEVDSMGGVVDGGGGIGLKTSPRRAAIEKAQKELRLEYDVREERRRELEFLEKGGNPLDFKLGNAASVSVQSTSLTDQHQEQFVTSEAKGSFVLTASPHGDSVDSSARPGVPSLSEPNTADNLLLFDGENELPEGEKRSLHSNKRNNIAPSEQSSRIGGCQNAKETEDSAIFRPYARRNRSKSNHGPRGASRDGKGIISDTNKQKDNNVPSVSKPKPTSLNGEMLSKDPTSNNNPLDNELVVVEARQTTSGSASVPKDKLDVTTNRNFKEDLRIMPSQDDAIQTPVVLVSGEAKSVGEMDLGASGDLEPPPCAATTQPGNESCSGQPNGFGNIKVDRRGVAIGDQNGSAALGMKNFDSESSCPQTSLARDVNNNNNDNNMCSNAKNIDENGNTMEQTSEFEKLNLTSCGVVKERSKTNTGATTNNEHHAGYESHPGGGNMVKSEEDIHIDSSCMQNKAEDSSNVKGLHHSESSISNADREGSVVLMDHPNRIREDSCERLKDVSISTTQTALVEKVTTTTSNCQPSSTHSLKLADKAHEDSILEEAKIIEVKRKRIAELSVRTFPSQIRRKSHWGFVLEEMAWLANDFAQERLWKISAAAQLSHQASCTSRLRFQKQNKHLGVKTLSHNMAKAVMQFWHSIELLLDNDVPDHKCIDGSVESGNIDSNVATGDKRSNSEMELETIKYLDGQNQTKHVAHKVHTYALRFLKDNRSCGISSQAEAPTTPDKICDSGIADMSWDDRLTEESLFYTVPPTAMEAYRKSIESHFLQFEKTGSSIQEEVETSIYDAAAEFGHEEIAYDEDEGETSTYYMHGVYEGSRSSKSLQKKHKNKIKSSTHKSSEIGIDLPYGHYTTAAQPSVLFGKRPASLNVGTIPTKRVRTASRQRVVSPFAGVSGTVHSQAKTDVSSGDTNSFQDDQSTLHGSQIHKSVEVESIGDFEKQLPYDCGETSVKTKKKKPKNLGPAYDQGWQLDSVVLNEQRDHSKKRLDSHHFEPNGSSGLYGHSAKKLKTTKQSLDTFDNVAPMTNSIPSPAASQMSNMSNPSKFIRIISSGRDRGRKAKALKVSAGQPGSGSPWSLFEDQALVVLVHDMGPNWELVSDAINSTIQFKCIFRKPKECKERHKILMDRSAGDGADSAEDSGSSQSYPSTLPGIPKGSARQLFQRLQGPMEEDTLKSHFDKIIKIGQKQRYHRNQNDNQDMKQLVPVHSSHVNALNQVCPNNLNGGFLTPLDLCDTNQASPDVLPLGYQVSHAGGLPLSNHSSASSVLPSAGLNSPSPTSSGISLSNNLSSSGQLAASVRDSRYGVSRTPPLSVDEQQRLQQYNQMISSRNMQQSTMSVPGSLSGSDRGGVRMLPGGNGMGMMGGINRSITMSRPGFQGMPSSSMLSSGGMLSSSMVGMPSPVNMHSGVGAGQGNSMLRPRETVHMMRPGHNQEHQRQRMVPELPMQVTQGNSQGIPAFSGMSSSFNNQTTPPSVQSYPGHSQQPHQLSQQQSHLSNPHPLQGPNHAAGNSQQAYAIRFAKERHLQHQQRYLQHQQQQQQLAASNALIPHAQAQSQLPISSPLQNSSQAQPQNSSQQVSLSPVTSTSPLTPMSSQHQQQKHHLQHGFSRNPSASALTNQATKQRQRQPQQRQFPQPGRQHPNQPQHAQSQQQTKVLKGLGRGNMLIHQNNSVDPSHLNGLSVPPGSQTVEKGDQIMPPMMQSQNIHPGSGNPNQSSKPLISARSSNHSQLQQKLHSGPTNTSLKQLQSVASPSDNRIQGHVLSVTSGHIASTPQPAVASNHHQLPLQSQPHCKQSNQAQPSVQRMLQPNCQVHSESSSMSQSDSTNIDQHPANSASQVGSNTVTSPGCMDAASVTVVPPTVSSQWQTSESPFDSSVSNPVTQVSFLGSTPVGNSAGNEPSTISQGMGPQQLSTSLPSHAHNSGGQWQQQQPPLKQTSSQPILSQKSYEPPEEHKQQQQEQEQLSPKGLALQRQAQQQVQHMQPGQSSLLICPPNSKVE